MNNTVVRGGFGMSFISYTNFNGVPSPVSSPITAASTPDTGLWGGNLSNPFPQINGVLPQPIGRNPAFDAQIQGLTISGIVAGATVSLCRAVEPERSDAALLELGLSDRLSGIEGHAHSKLAEPESIAEQLCRSGCHAVSEPG